MLLNVLIMTVVMTVTSGIMNIQKYKIIVNNHSQNYELFKNTKLLHDVQ